MVDRGYGLVLVRLLQWFTQRTVTWASSARVTVQWLTQRSTDAKKARAFYVVLVLCADWWVSRSVVNRADGMVVVWLVQWYKTSEADRFTAPYARTGGFRGRWLTGRMDWCWLGWCSGSHNEP